MAETPTIEIDYDLYGHCVKCHKCMLKEQVVDGKPIKRLTGECTDASFMLNNGSIMRVMICTSCKSNLKEEDKEKIMKSVYKGWEVETDLLITSRYVNASKNKTWDNDMKKEYLEKMKKLDIVTQTDGKDIDTLDRELKKYRQKEKVKNGSNK